MQFNIWKNLKIAISSCLIVAFLFSSFIFVIQSAHATGLAVSADDKAAQLQRKEDLTAKEKKWLKDYLEKKREEAWRKMVAATVTNAARAFTTKLAKQAALYVASGLPGQKTAIQVEPWGEVMSSAADGALGEFMAGMGEAYNLGNLCEGLPWEGFLESLSFGLEGGSDEFTPECTFSELKEAWDITDPALLSKISIGFTPGNGGNDIFQFMDESVNASAQILGKQLEEDENLSETWMSGGFKGLKDDVTGWTMTPGSMLKEHVGQNLFRVNDNFVVTAEPFYDALNVFASTLMQQVQNLYLKEGLVNLGDLMKKKEKKSTGFKGFDKSGLSKAVQSITDPSGLGSGSLAGRGVAQQLIDDNIVGGSTLAAPASFDFLSELLNCPDDKAAAKLYNCALPQQLKVALDKIEGEHLTVQEAVDNDILDANLIFAYKDPARRVEPNLLEGIPFIAIQKLRRARIIPMGWEIAGRLLRKRTELKTLGDLMQEFDDRGVDGLCNPDAPDEGESPYCNLVNPQWILKAPAYNCRSTQWGQLLQPGSSQRFDYCADIQDCVVEDDNGKCLSFGYCARDKNIWRLKGDRCNRDYQGCKNFVRTKDNSDYYYVNQTLDLASCNRQNAGCSWYSTEKNEEVRIFFKFSLWEAEDVTKRRYFNRNIIDSVCDESEVGCHKFIRFAENMKAQEVDDAIDETAENPDFFEYSDYGTLQDLYMKVDPTIPKDENPLFCAREFVGCEEYAPANRDPSVTAIIDPLDQCPVECLKYDSYIQEPTYFEMRKFGVDFIPTTGLSCDAANEGCEQFTNLDAPERGGENIENFKLLRQCKKFGDDTKTYFYWEGTETGYQLNRFSLIKGSPITYSYIDGQDNNIQVNESGVPPAYIKGLDTSFNVQCNQEVFDDKLDPDCFELFDENGDRWFRKLSFTISSPSPDFFPGGVIPFEDACHNYRKTLSGELICNLNATCNSAQGCACSVADLNCTVQQGHDSCSDDLSCINTGGEWFGGECIYQAIPNESIPCSTIGCKQYKGSTARNEKNVIFDTFESSAINPRWSSRVEPPQRSNVSLLFEGNSFKFKNELQFDLSEQCELPLECALRGGCQCITNDGNVCSVQRGEKECTASFVSETRSYVAKFLMRNSTVLPTTATIMFGDNADQADMILGSATTVTGDWIEVVIGPMTFTRSVSAAEKMFIVVLQEESPGLLVRPTTHTFIDNFILREERDSFYLVENSWETPSSCETDPPLTGGIAQTSMLGCKSYIDRFGSELYLKSFRNLCPSNMVGCEAVIDTHNSDNIAEEYFNKGDVAEVYVPADNIEYVINDPIYYCSSDSEACRAMALPTLGQNDKVRSCDIGVPCDKEEGCRCVSNFISQVECTVKLGENTCEAWDEVFILDDPDGYKDTLCRHSELWCEEFATEDSLSFFKDPKDKYCEFKPIPKTIPLEFAWFKAGDNKVDDANAAECICDYRSVFTDQERTCKLAASCNDGAGCPCVIDEGHIQQYYGTNTTNRTCLVPFEEDACEINDLKAWFSKDSGIINPVECRGLDASSDLIWANTCPAGQSDCTTFIEPSSCQLRKGACFLPPIEENGRVLLKECSPARVGAWNAAWSWPDDQINNPSGGCLCDNGQTECYVRPGEVSCVSEYDWYRFREDKKDQINNIDISNNIYLDQECIIGVACNDLGGCSCTQPDGKNCLVPFNQTSCRISGNVFEVDRFCDRYYYLNDEKIDRSSCNGVVNWFDECVLFNDTSNTNLPFTSRDIFSNPEVDSSLGIQNIKVCDSGDKTRCDTNVLLSVIRDRTCDEWLQCNTSMRRWDKSQKKFKDTCFSLGRCLNSNSHFASQCIEWAKSSIDKEILTTSVYQSRFTDPNKTNWYTSEYAGHSVYDIFKLDTLKQRDYSRVGTNEKIKDFKLTNFTKALWNEGCQGGCGTAPGGGTTQFTYSCAQQSGKINAWCQAECQLDSDCLLAQNAATFAGLGGNQFPVCKLVTVKAGGQLVQQGRCYIDIGIDGKTKVSRKECRGYPEDDSPIPYNADAVEFSETLKPDITINISGTNITQNFSDYGRLVSRIDEFEKASFGFVGNRSVECHYQKVSYGQDNILYYNEDPPAEYPIKDKLYFPAGTPEEPATSSQWPFESSVLYLGWKGYCLEWDRNFRINAEPEDRACITWWPVDHIRGEIDIGEMPLKAVWQAGIGEQYYCMKSEAKEIRQDITAFFYANDSAVCPNPGPSTAYETFRYSNDDDDPDVTCGAHAIPQSGPYKFTYDFDGLALFEVGFTTCVQWAQIQELPSQINKVFENAVATTKIRSLPKSFAKYWGGYTIPNLGYQLDGYDQAAWSFSDADIQWQPGSSFSSLIKAGPLEDTGRTFLSPFGASCLRPGGCASRSLTEKPIGELTAADDVIEVAVRGDISGGQASIFMVCHRDKGCQRTACLRFGNPPLETTEIPLINFYLGGIQPRSRNDVDLEDDFSQQIYSRSQGCAWSGPANNGPYPRDGKDTKAVHSKAIYAIHDRVLKYGGAPFDTPSAGFQSNNDGLQNLSNIFGKIYRVTDNQGNPDPAFQYIELGGEVPIIRPSLFDGKEYFEAAQVGGNPVTNKFAVNNEVDVEIKGERFLLANISFYTYNQNGEQMPLRQVVLDWGDGTDPIVIEGFLKNRKRTCERYCAWSIDANPPAFDGDRKVSAIPDDPNAWRKCNYNYECGKDASKPENRCVPFTFGDSPVACLQDTEDETGSFIFSHVYNCRDSYDESYNPDILACEFFPRVLVEDNWGESTVADYAGEIVVRP